MGPRCFGKACVKDDPLYDLSLLLSIAYVSQVIELVSLTTAAIRSSHCLENVIHINLFFYDSSFSLNNVALMTDKLVNDLHLSKIDVIF
jgi:hypothetical protein